MTHFTSITDESSALELHQWSIRGSQKEPSSHSVRTGKVPIHLKRNISQFNHLSVMPLKKKATGAKVIFGPDKFSFFPPKKKKVR